MRLYSSSDITESRVKVTRFVCCDCVECSSASVCFGGSRPFQLYHYACIQSISPHIYLFAHFVYVRLPWPTPLHPRALSRFQLLRASILMLCQTKSQNRGKRRNLRQYLRPNFPWKSVVTPLSSLVT